MRTKRQRTKFKEFKFEKPEITYNKKHFDSMNAALDHNEKRLKKQEKKIRKAIDEGIKHVQYLSEKDLVPSILEAKPKVIREAKKYVDRLNEVGENAPTPVRAITDAIVKERFSNEGPDVLFAKYICHEIGVNYDNLSLVAEPTIENIIKFAIEEVTDQVDQAMADKVRLATVLTEIERDKISLNNLALYAQDTERTDLNYETDIPQSFRNELMEQLDEQLMKEQGNFENCMEQYKYEKSKLKKMKEALPELSPFKQKIAKMKLAEKSAEMKEDGNTLREHKEYLNGLSERRNYFFDVIEGLPK